MIGIRGLKELRDKNKEMKENNERKSKILQAIEFGKEWEDRDVTYYYWFLDLEKQKQSSKN